MVLSLSNRIGVANELRAILGKHEDRADFGLSMAVNAGKSLREIFDKYIRKELDDLKAQVQLLQQVGRELEKEQEALEDMERRFEKTDGRLGEMVSLAEEGKIKSLSWAGIVESVFKMPAPRTKSTREKPVEDFEIDTLVKGFALLGELEELRKDIESRSRVYVRDIDDLLSVVDERFRQLGSSE